MFDSNIENRRFVVVYDAIAAGNNNHQLLQKACPDLNKKMIQHAVQHLKDNEILVATKKGRFTDFTLVKSREEMLLTDSLYKRTMENKSRINTGTKDFVHFALSDELKHQFNCLAEKMLISLVTQVRERAIQELQDPAFVQDIIKVVLEKFSSPISLTLQPVVQIQQHVTPNTIPTDSVVVQESMENIESPQPSVTPTEPVVLKPKKQRAPYGSLKRAREAAEAEKRLGATSTNQSDVSVSSETYNIKPPQEPEKSVARLKLPRVCVTGLKPIEAGRLTQEFCETFDLQFWNNRQGDPLMSLRAAANNCDAIFWHTKHSSHSSEPTAKGGKAEFIRVGGDLSMMRKALTKYYQEKYATKTA